MISYEDVLYSVTNIISDNFDCDVIVDDSEGIFDKECFYVTIIPVKNVTNTQITNDKSLVISVKYFNNNKIKNYEVANVLEDLFVRDLKVKDKHLMVSDTDVKFLKDEVGNMLDFLIFVKYIEAINIVDETFDNVGNVDIDLIIKGGD